jgi:hypothetical protein
VCTRYDFRHAAWLTACSAVLLAAPVSSADVIRLKSGRTIRGKIVADQSVTGVAVRIETGALIVFARNEIEQTAPSRKSAVAAGPSQRRAVANRAIREDSPRPAALHPRPKPTGRGRQSLTPEEKAWFPRVRSLGNRLVSDEPAQSRRAKADLLKINDASALPALTRDLQDSPSDAARRLYVAILRQIPGDESTALLVAQSIGDVSPGVRADARQALDPPRAKAARRLYIDFLRTGSPLDYGVEAQGLAEIGDPHLDSVPYLIEALVEHTTQELFEPGRAPQYSDCMTEMIAASQPKFFSVPRDEGRSDVLDALLKITNQPYPAYGFNVIQWRQWFANSRQAKRPESRERREWGKGV